MRWWSQAVNCFLLLPPVAVGSCICEFMPVYLGDLEALVKSEQTARWCPVNLFWARALIFRTHSEERKVHNVATHCRFGVGFGCRWRVLRPYPLGIPKRRRHRARYQISDSPHSLPVGVFALRRSPPLSAPQRLVLTCGAREQLECGLPTMHDERRTHEHYQSFTCHIVQIPEPA